MYLFLSLLLGVLPGPQWSSVIANNKKKKKKKEKSISREEEGMNGMNGLITKGKDERESEIRCELFLFVRSIDLNR
jgi:hypothetical protein